MNLSNIKTNQHCIIKSINAKGKLLQKLLDMGFVQGIDIQIIRVAPLNDPMLLRIHNYDISIRVNEAMFIEVVCE